MRPCRHLGGAAEPVQPLTPQCCLARWEDGEQVTRHLEGPDRWEVHSAEEVVLCMDHLTIQVVQQVSGGGVGAGHWAHGAGPTERGPGKGPPVVSTLLAPH